MHGSLLKRTALFAAASSVGIGIYAQTSEDAKQTMQAVQRIVNLGLCVGAVSGKYLYYFKFTDRSGEKSYTEELTKLKELQEIEKAIVQSSEKNDYENLTSDLKEVKAEMVQVSKRMLRLKSNKLHEVHLSSAKLVRDLCMKNKGVYIKLGQHLSQLDYIFPEEYCTILRDLLDKNPTSTIDEVQQLFQEEFRCLPTDMFASFSSVPIASASLAQVHTAIGKDGQKYAVKVQHRHLRDSAPGDMRAITMAIQFVSKVFKDFQFEWLVREMNMNLPLELDFQ